MARKITVRGVVQGVGFRPFVYRLAHRHDLTGWVVNSSRGVVIEVDGPEAALAAFEQALTEEAPPLARIDGVESDDTGSNDGPAGFEIRVSERDPGETTLICPDVAVCPDCLREFLEPSDRRHRYPFINCTNCGPRFSIIESTPYDRPATSMKTFTMCKACQTEYDDPLDRRFHAQPNACPECGPQLTLSMPAPPERAAEIVLGRSYVRTPEDVAAVVTSDPAAVTRWLLKRGGIVGVRGLGGFHIAADARLDSTVRALREKKARPAKPFALMCRSLASARGIAVLGSEEEEALSSPWSPIVIARKRAEPSIRLSDLVAPRNGYLGIMLPYAPVQHLLFDDDLEVLIMTSANPANEPIVADIDEAGRRMPEITRTFLDHNREVVNRSDDSIVFVETGRTMMSRRSRGYAPYPIDVDRKTTDVLACGTELKNTFTLLSDGRAFVSQHIGDLENEATLEFYREMVEKFAAWFRLRPRVIAHDLHPDYLATRYAKELAASGRGRSAAGPGGRQAENAVGGPAEDPCTAHADRAEEPMTLVGVQHHHAHIASVMVENRVSEPVIGLALDGTGYGTDGKIWGCEFLVAELTGFERVGHLSYVPLPGGDAAIRHPYRVALSHLHSAGAGDLGDLAENLFGDVPASERDLVVQQIEKGVNCIDTSSAGRLFDAVSAILGVCTEISYEAQAAIELESLIEHGGVNREPARYPFEISDSGDGFVVDPSATVAGVYADVIGGRPREEVARAFHETVVAFCRDACVRLAEERGIRRVALSGGVFQNRYLLRRLDEVLSGDGFAVLLNREVPTNDGGVSLGQAIVASERVLAGLE